MSVEVLMRALLVCLALLAVPCLMAEEQGGLPEWKSRLLPRPEPQKAAAASSDVPVYIGTTGFAWGSARTGTSRRGWTVTPHALGFPAGGFLFSHGPAGNFSLLGGARTFHPRARFFSGFKVRHGFVLRGRR